MEIATPDSHLGNDSKDSAIEIPMDAILGENDENSEASFSLTVMSNGAIISGTVISRWAWTDLLQEALYRGLGLDPTTVPKEERVAEPRKAGVARRYFHMKDVSVYQGGIPLSFDHWRGTLADVTGWSLGRLTSDPAR